MEPKDLAITIQLLARNNYAASEEYLRIIEYAIKQIIIKLRAEPYLFEIETDSTLNSLFCEEFGSQEADQASEESNCYVTPLTLGIYYYAFAKLTRNQRYDYKIVFSQIASYLVFKECPMFSMDAAETNGL